MQPQSNISISDIYIDVDFCKCECVSFVDPCDCGDIQAPCDSDGDVASVLTFSPVAMIQKGFNIEPLGVFVPNINKVESHSISPKLIAENNLSKIPKLKEFLKSGGSIRSQQKAIG